MNLNFRKLIWGLRSVKCAFSTAIFERKNMVRYFANPYEDLEPEASPTFDKDSLKGQINEYIASICKRLHATRKNVDGGLYVGATGISYMFLHISKNVFLSESKDLYLNKSLEYLKPALEASTGDKTSFLLGDAGTYAIATVVYKVLGSSNSTESLKIYRSLYHNYLKPKFLKCGGDEFFVGRSGYIAGALWISKELKTAVLTNEEYYKLCDTIVASGRDYSMKRNSPCPLMFHYYNTEYLGAAHGISFILQMLLTVPGYLASNKLAESHIHATIDYLTSLQTEDGNWPCCLEEVGQPEHKLVHWCHGAPGMVYLMAKAYLVYKDEKYKDACIKAADCVWAKGLLRKGPGICHGVAGNGYVFLLLFRLTNDQKYLNRAKKFADFLNEDEFISDARLPDNPESLYEGTAGTICFLADLLVPDKAEFPFQDVFFNYNNESVHSIPT